MLNKINNLVNNNYWCKSALMRAIKTFFQTFVATVSTSKLITEVNWIMVFSASTLSFILSIATSLAGLPEVEQQEERKKIEQDMIDSYKLP